MRERIVKKGKRKQKIFHHEQVKTEKCDKNEVRQ